VNKQNNEDESCSELVGVGVGVAGDDDDGNTRRTFGVGVGVGVARPIAGKVNSLEEEVCDEKVWGEKVAQVLWIPRLELRWV
jgi:hypothetical protein